MRKKTQYIVVNEIYKTIYCGYPQKRAWKNFTTAEGGASTWRDIEGIDNEAIYHQYQLFSLHGQSKDALAKTQIGAWEYDIVGPWYKYNMTDIMAAIGLCQLDRYEGMLKRRKEIIERYDEMCDEMGVKHLNHSGEDFQSSNHLYLSRVPGIGDSERREYLQKSNIRFIEGILRKNYGVSITLQRNKKTNFHLYVNPEIE